MSEILDLDAFLLPDSITVKYKGQEIEIAPPTLQMVIRASLRYRSLLREAQERDSTPGPQELGAAWLAETTPFSYEDVLAMPHVLYMALEAFVTEHRKTGNQGEKDKSGDDDEEQG